MGFGDSCTVGVVDGKELGFDKTWDENEDGPSESVRKSLSSSSKSETFCLL